MTRRDLKTHRSPRNARPRDRRATVGCRVVGIFGAGRCLDVDGGFGQLQLAAISLLFFIERLLEKLGML